VRTSPPDTLAPPAQKVVAEDLRPIRSQPEVGAVASPRRRVTRDLPHVGREAGTGRGRHTSGTGRSTRVARAPGSRSGSKQGRDLVVVDPWGMFLEQLLKPAADDDGHGGKRGRGIDA
jgi:hypothetical protein